METYNISSSFAEKLAIAVWLRRALLLRTRKDHQRFFYLAREILKGIRSQVFIPQACWMCTDCEYRKPCANWSGG